MRLLIPVVAAFMASCATVNEPADPARLFERVPGTWAAVVDGKLSCDRTRETITFSADRSSARFDSTSKYLMGPGKPSTNTITYKIIRVRGNVMTMKMDGEFRKTDSGELFVWNLILLGDDEFAWHRTDWPLGETTVPRRRCKGYPNRPVM